MTNSISRKCCCILQLTHRGRRFTLLYKSSNLHADWDSYDSSYFLSTPFMSPADTWAAPLYFWNFSALSNIDYILFSLHSQEFCHRQTVIALQRSGSFLVCFELLLFGLESSMGTLLLWESPCFLGRVHIIIKPQRRSLIVQQVGFLDTDFNKWIENYSANLSDWLRSFNIISLSVRSTLVISILSFWPWTSLHSPMLARWTSMATW